MDEENVLTKRRQVTDTRKTIHSDVSTDPQICLHQVKKYNYVILTQNAGGGGEGGGRVGGWGGGIRKRPEEDSYIKNEGEVTVFLFITTVYSHLQSFDFIHDLKRRRIY